MHVQIREKFYFLCQNWLAVEKSDGLIDRVFFVLGEAQNTEINYLIQKPAKQNLSDDHLLISIFARPVHSLFTRLNIVTCTFLLLCISMLMNITYYDLASGANESFVPAIMDTAFHYKSVSGNILKYFTKGNF